MVPVTNPRGPCVHHRCSLWSLLSVRYPREISERSSCYLQVLYLCQDHYNSRHNDDAKLKRHLQQPMRCATQHDHHLVYSCHRYVTSGCVEPWFSSHCGNPGAFMYRSLFVFSYFHIFYLCVWLIYWIMSVAGGQKGEGFFSRHAGKCYVSSLEQSDLTYRMLCFYACLISNVCKGVNVEIGSPDRCTFVNPSVIDSSQLTSSDTCDFWEKLWHTQRWHCVT